MARQVLTDCRVFVGAADLSAWANKVEIKRSAESKEITTYGSGGAKEFLGGLKSHGVALEGFNEAGDLTKPDDVLDPLTGVVGPWTVCPGDATVGALAFTLNVLTEEYAIGGAVGDVDPFKAGGNGTGGRGRGMILHPPGTPRTATGVGTAVQLGAVAAGRTLVANLHVHSLTAGASITVAIQSDDASGFASPLTVLTFAAATAPGGQQIRVAGPNTDTWYRVSYTISGTTPSVLFTTALGIA